MATQWIVPPAEYDPNKSAHANKYRARGVLKCPCGAEVDVGAAMHGPNYAAKCPKSDHWFNLVGQELSPPSQWEENRYDD